MQPLLLSQNFEVKNYKDLQVLQGLYCLQDLQVLQELYCSQDIQALQELYFSKDMQQKFY